MIWRLMATVLTLAEPGGATTDSHHSDWPSEQQCQQMIADFYKPPPPQKIDGKMVTIRIVAACVAVGGPVAIGPPQAYVGSYMRGDLPRSQMLAPPCGGRLPCDY